MQSALITTNVVSSHPSHGKVYSIQNYDIKLGRSVLFSGYSCFLQQYNWPPGYNWSDVESDAKHYKLSSFYYFSIGFWKFSDRVICVFLFLLQGYWGLMIMPSNMRPKLDLQVSIAYIVWLVIQCFLYTLPIGGKLAYGLPLRGGHRLQYRLNGN